MKKILFLFLFIISSHFFSQTSVAAMQNAESSFDKMSELFRTGKYEEAEKIGGELLSNEMISNKSVVKFYALYLLGNCYYFEGKYKKATESFQKLVEFDGSEVDKKEYKSILANAKDLLKDLAPKLSLDTSPETKTSGTGSVNGKSVSNISNTNSQENKTVTLTVSGTGKTLEEAKTNALRSAIEQAFGAFISSKTEMLNDNIMKDEIVSVSNGNIQKFDVVSQVEIPNNGYAVTLNATVSVSKLTSFVESKGVAVEFKGSLFAFNITQQDLNEQNEIKIINDMCNIIRPLTDKAFDYKLRMGNPYTADGSNNTWKVPIKIDVTVNENFFNIINYFFQTLKALSLTKDEAIAYRGLKKGISPLIMAVSNDYDYFILRKGESVESLVNQLYYFEHSILNFKIFNGINEFSGSDNLKFKSFNDENFKIRLSLKLNRYDRPQYKYKNLGVLFPSKEYEKEPNFILPLEVNMDYPDKKSTEEIMLESFDYYSGKFSFINGNKKLLKKMLFGNKIYFGEFISFMGLTTNSIIATLEYEDTLSIDEIKKIQEYKVIPLNN